MELMHMPDSNDIYSKDTPTLWHDVIRNLVGKRVLIFTEHHSPMSGILADFNGYIIKTVSPYNKNDNQATYYPVSKIISITEMSDEY